MIVLFQTTFIYVIDSSNHHSSLRDEEMMQLRIDCNSACSFLLLKVHRICIPFSVIVVNRSFFQELLLKIKVVLVMVVVFEPSYYSNLKLPNHKNR
mmetsp:Transcript_34406/g.81109  ORF Transcript_34406/g.81109 Transcript_34406/m.81109 type:complete len:96 (+) Transcript_34406:1579-1866(+)